MFRTDGEKSLEQISIIWENVYAQLTFPISPIYDAAYLEYIHLLSECIYIFTCEYVILSWVNMIYTDSDLCYGQGAGEYESPPNPIWNHYKFNNFLSNIPS